MSAPRIWVIGWDYGLEGKSEPQMAFWTEAEARQAAVLIDKAPCSPRLYVAVVPMWPSPTEAI